jgi:hypothetical protein
MDYYGLLWIPMDSYGFLWTPMDSFLLHTYSKGLSTSFMSTKVQLSHDLTALTAEILANPTEWQWASDFMKNIASLEIDLETGKNERESFYKSMVAAALSPGALKVFKKKHGPDYHPNLLRVLDGLRPCVDKMASALTKVKDMASANSSASSAASAAMITPLKRKRLYNH